jgi:hypothetical protein
MPWRLSRVEVLGRGVVDRAMLLLDTSCLIEFEDELALRRMGPARGILAAWRTAALRSSLPPSAWGK